MARVSLPIAQGFYVDESIPISAQRCVNLYPHIPQTKTITDASLIGTSGIDFAVETYPVEPIRGIHTMSGVPYYVRDDVVYWLEYTEDAFGVRTYTEDFYNTIFVFVQGSDYVVMADNGDQLMIVCPDYVNAQNAYVYTKSTNSLAQVPAGFIGRAIYTCYMDGYFLFAQYDSNVFFCSNLRDGETYTATDFASAESDPDSIVALLPLNGILYVFGTVTYEQWQNSGGAGFPFTKAVSGSGQKGCLAPRSLIEFNNSLVWVGGGKNEQPAIWSTNGGAPVKLSTPAIDTFINDGGISQLALAVSKTWSSKGHYFLNITVPSVCSVTYDATTGLWHERESVEGGNVIPWRVGELTTAYSVKVVSDSIDGRIGIMDDEIYTEYNENIQSYFVTPAFDNGGKPFTINSLELMMETGTEPISGSGSTPSVRLAVSDNGGRTFYPDISRFMGYTGDYVRRISWDLLGRYSRSVCFKGLIDEPIKKVFVKGEIDIAN